MARPLQGLQGIYTWRQLPELASLWVGLWEGQPLQQAAGGARGAESAWAQLAGPVVLCGCGQAEGL